MLTALLHRIVAHPRVYDACQAAAGGRVFRRRLGEAIVAVGGGAGKVVLDIGGGTGGSREQWPAGTRYVCLDLDPMKLAGYVAKNPGGMALLADATELPLGEGSLDVVVCTMVTHHLTDAQLDRMLAEAARVLGAEGRLVLMDAVWAPRRWPGRLLWRYDRGSYPRTEGRLREAIERHFEVVRWERFAVWHAYVLAVGRRRGLD